MDNIFSLEYELNIKDTGMYIVLLVKSFNFQNRNIYMLYDEYMFNDLKIPKLFY